jgi:hypothetical protein
MARIGRPRTKIDRQEMVGCFSKMSAEDREWLLSVMTGINDALTPEEPEQEEVKP